MKKLNKNEATVQPAHVVRTVDATAYLEALCALIEEEKQVTLRISGGSMLPFLAGGRDSVFLAAPDKKLKKGDICLYRRASGQFVLHRLWRLQGNICYFLGDAQTEIEGPLRQEQIHAKVTAALRKGRLLTPADATWQFYAKLWTVLRPLRPTVLRLARKFHRRH